MHNVCYCVADIAMRLCHTADIAQIALDTDKNHNHNNCFDTGAACSPLAQVDHSERQLEVERVVDIAGDTVVGTVVDACFFVFVGVDVVVAAAHAKRQGQVQDPVVDDRELGQREGEQKKMVVTFRRDLQEYRLNI